MDPTRGSLTQWTSTWRPRKSRPVPASCGPRCRTRPIHTSVRDWYLRAPRDSGLRSPTGAVPHRHPPSRTVLRRWRHNAARVRIQSGWAARSSDRLSRRRASDAGVQPAAAVSDDAALRSATERAARFFTTRGTFSTGGGRCHSSAAPVAPVFPRPRPTSALTNCTNQLSYFSHTMGFECATTRRSAR